jgi:hypothetical protein
LDGSKSSNVSSGEPRLYATRPWHKDLVTLEKNPDLDRQRLRMLYELGA